MELTQSIISKLWKDNIAVFLSGEKIALDRRPYVRRVVDLKWISDKKSIFPSCKKEKVDVLYM